MNERLRESGTSIAQGTREPQTNILMGTAPHATSNVIGNLILSGIPYQLPASRARRQNNTPILNSIVLIQA